MSSPPEWTCDVRPGDVPNCLRGWEAPEQSNENLECDDQCVPGRRSPVKGRTSSFRVSRTSVFESHTSSLKQGHLSIWVNSDKLCELGSVAWVVLLSFALIIQK